MRVIERNRRLVPPRHRDQLHHRPSYGDIFYGNCFQNALLPIRLPPDAVEELMRQAETHSEPFVEIDLERCTVTAPDDTQWTFEIGDYHRNTLLHGLDEIDATLTRIVAIEAHEHAYLRDRPWLATTS